MRKIVRFGISLGAFALLAAGCGDDKTNTCPPVADRTYVQIDRLGNPLTSEVFLAKRQHGAHKNGQRPNNLFMQNHDCHTPT